MFESYEVKQGFWGCLELLALKSRQNLVREQPRLRHIITQFSISFFENIGGVLYNYDRTIHSAAVDTSFDTRFEFNKFL